MKFIVYSIPTAEENYTFATRTKDFNGVLPFRNFLLAVGVQLCCANSVYLIRFSRYGCAVWERSGCSPRDST